MRPHDLGGLTIENFHDGGGSDAPFANLFPSATPAQIQDAFQAFGPQHINPEKATLRLSMHSFLLRTRGRLILVDTCIGNHKVRPTRPIFHQRNTDYLGNLRKLGVAPEQIDFVFCTHMHSDHVGWNTMLKDGRWVPTFPKARYVMARREYESCLAKGRATSMDTVQHGSFADSVLPVIESGQALIVDESDHVCDDIRIESVPGHTPGNVVVHAVGRAGAAIVTGDVFVTPFQIQFPEVLTRLCDDPAQSRNNRIALLERLADTPTLVLPAHFSDPTAGVIRRAGARFTYNFVE